MTSPLIKPRKVLSWNYSFLVTLPLPWVDFHKLNKGDLIGIDVDEKGRLILEPMKNKKVSMKNEKQQMFKI